MDGHNMNKSHVCVIHTPSDTIPEEVEQYRELEQWLNQWLYAPRRYSAEPRTWIIYWEKVNEE